MLPTIAVPPLPFGLVGGDRIQATTSRGQIDYVDDGCERERRDLRQQVIWQRQELHVDFVRHTLSSELDGELDGGVGELDGAGLGIPGNSRVRQIRLSCDDSDFTVFENEFLSDTQCGC